MKSFQILLLVMVALAFSSCVRDEHQEEKASPLVNMNSAEVLMDFVDRDGRNMLESGSDDFRIMLDNDSVLKPAIVQKDGMKYLGFKPVITEEICEKENTYALNAFSKIYWKDKVVAEIESSFRLDSVCSVAGASTLYYTNVWNKAFHRPIDTPVRVLIGESGSYREEGQAKFCVVYNFPSVGVLPTYSVDYQVNIWGFEGQAVKPIQKAIVMTGNPDGTQQVMLAIEGRVHNYYDLDGRLQTPNRLTYEMTSQQLYDNNESHLLGITNSGDCYSNKILECSLDGRSLSLDSVVAKNSFGGEYINLTIE